MPFDLLVEQTLLFLLIFARIFALLQIAPLLSSEAVPPIARIGLALFTAFAVFPWVDEIGYHIPALGGAYILLLVGEVMLGLITGFMLTVIYATFLLAGQFFSLQMGFGASQVYDPLAQIELPMMGQFLNIVAMLVFILTMGFQKIFLAGVLRSFESVKAVDLLFSNETVINLILNSLSQLFEQAMIISFPILGTLILVSVAMGLLAKAAPQMNLLMLGFPLKIGVAFLMLFVTLPLLMEAFSRLIDASFIEIVRLIESIAGGAS